MRPQVLDANQPVDRFYAGGRQIATFRRVPSTRRNVPEDWVASTTTLFGETVQGLSRLPDGQLLLDAVRSDPEAWLGPDHVGVFGDDTYLLVKLLDAGQRLPIHVHPDMTFAGKSLGLAHGKAEAWVFLHPATVHLAFHRQVSEEELARWVDEQDVNAMLTAMHSLPVERGDAVLVPAGMPHAIGEGAFLVELQEPTDLSILLEWAGFDIDGTKLGHLGLGFEVALRAVDRRAWSSEAVETLRGARSDSTGDLLPDAATYFRVHRSRGNTEWDAGFTVLVVIDGVGRLWTDGSESVPLHAGQTAVVPFSSGPCRLAGDPHFEVLRCQPPSVHARLHGRSLSG